MLKQRFVFRTQLGSATSGKKVVNPERAKSPEGNSISSKLPGTFKNRLFRKFKLLLEIFLAFDYSLKLISVLFPGQLNSLPSCSEERLQGGSKPLSFMLQKQENLRAMPKNWAKFWAMLSMLKFTVWLIMIYPVLSMKP